MFVVLGCHGRNERNDLLDFTLRAIPLYAQVDSGDYVLEPDTANLRNAMRNVNLQRNLQILYQNSHWHYEKKMGKTENEPNLWRK